LGAAAFRLLASSSVPSEGGVYSPILPS